MTTFPTPRHRPTPADDSAKPWASRGQAHPVIVTAASAPQTRRWQVLLASTDVRLARPG